MPNLPTVAAEPAISALPSSDADRLARIEESIRDLGVRQRATDIQLDANTRATEQLAASTHELVEFFGAMKGAMKVFDLIGKLARPLGAIVALGAAVLGLYTAARGHK